MKAPYEWPPTATFEVSTTPLLSPSCTTLFTGSTLGIVSIQASHNVYTGILNLHIIRWLTEGKSRIQA